MPLRIGWPTHRNIVEDEITKAKIFLRFDGERIFLGQTNGVGEIVWPNGDLTKNRRWKLSLQIATYAEKWSANFDFKWRVGTSKISIPRRSDEDSRPKRAGGTLLDRLPKDDPNYELANRIFRKSWADSHRLVADAASGNVSLVDYVEGCVRTFKQGIDLHVGIKDDSSIEDRWKEMDRMGKLFTAKFGRSLKKEANRLGIPDVSEAVEICAARVMALTSRGKARILEKVGPPDPFKVLGDRPLGDNPFPRSFAAHDAFEEATWHAKAEMSQLYAECVTAADKPLPEVINAVLLFRLRSFSKCAFHGLAVVGNSYTARWFEEWLEDEARYLHESTIELFQKRDPALDPAAPHPISTAEIEQVKTTLTLELTKIIAHYKGVAASRMTEVVRLTREAEDLANQEPEDLAVVHHRDGAPVVVASEPVATNPESGGALSSLEPRPSGESAKTPILDPKLQKMRESVARYELYKKELRAIEVACKKHQTPELLMKQFPDFEVWAVLDKNDKVDIVNGAFAPGRFAWALVKRLNGLGGKDDRTLKNYRRALKTAGIEV